MSAVVDCPVTSAKLIFSKSFKKKLLSGCPEYSKDKPDGITLQLIILKTNTIIGATKKIIAFARVGINNSLKTNFAPSANGCNKPQNPTTFGPFLLCIAAITFLSAIVK